MKVTAIFKSLYNFWMKIVFVLSWVNTRVLLFLIFYLILTPTGLILKLLRKDLLEQGISKADKSYWKIKDKNEFEAASYEKQF